jgi:tetratricopeptide (TPR) repeat protein
MCLAEVADSSAGDEAPQAAATQPAPAEQPSPQESGTPSPSLAPLAKEFLEEAKARLAAQQRERAEREQARRREESQRLAIQMAREKARQQAEKNRQAQRQLQLARERRLKFLYQQGLSLYRQGSYAEAIEMLQQMALLDPAHPLVRPAERLLAQAEFKRFEQQVRAKATWPATQAGEAKVPELERLLAQKRIEVETVLKYAKTSIRDRQYPAAIELLHRVLNQDPLHREALQMMEQAQTAKLNEEGRHLKRQALVDEQQMMNEVTRAELLNPTNALGQTIRDSSRALPTPTSGLPSAFAEPISFDFQDVAFSDVLDFLADAANVSIIPSPHIDLKMRRVSLRVDQLPLGLALKYLVKSQDLACRMEDNVILIASAEEFANEPLETRVFFLQSGLSPFALETSAVAPNPVLKMESIKDLLEQSVPQLSGSKLIVDERSGSLVVTNTAENLRLVERLLSQLDILPVQVLIEARFVEVTLTELEQLGFESVLTGNVALTKKKAADGTLGAGHQVAKSGGMKFPALSRESEGLNLTLQGVLNNTQFEAAMHLLEETQKSKTLSAPRVTTLNNQAASIKVVDEFRYPTRYEVSLVQFDVNGDGDFDDAGETEFVNVPQDFQKRDVGILLNVTPSVGKDLKTITLVLAPEVSQFSQFRDLGGGVTVPEFTSSQLTTSVVMDDGQTVVLGGLMKDTTSSQLTKVPVLGDLPLLGNLFRQQEESQARKNLLIFVTARILAPRGPTI